MSHAGRRGREVRTDDTVHAHTHQMPISRADVTRRRHGRIFIFNVTCVLGLGGATAGHGHKSHMSKSDASNA